MSSEHDPALARTLELGLASPVPGVLARRRIEARVSERLGAESRRRSPLLVLGVAAAVGALLLLAVPRFSRTSAPPAPANWATFTAARARVLPDGKLEVVRDDAGGTELRLVQGTALFHVQKGSGRSFVVHAGADRVEVVGTVFGVALQGEHAAVEVREGVVELGVGGVVRRLAAGQTWPPATELFSRAAPDLAALSAPFPARPTPPGPPPAVSALSVNDLPLAPAPPRAETKPAGREAPSAFQRARELEQRGDQAGARAAFEAIARSGDANAEDAAFALVRLPAQQGEPALALAGATEYRRSYPNGRYGRDVDVLELNAHLALHDEHAALRDADAFLHRFGDDSRAWRFRLVRAAGHARAGHCELARSLLESVPAGSAKSTVLARCPEPRP